MNSIMLCVSKLVQGVDGETFLGAAMYFTDPRLSCSIPLQ
jgi:hypothetical protein